MTRTLAIIKPDATKRNITGEINTLIERAGFEIIGQKRIRMTKADAESFYAAYSHRPFFSRLVDSISSGPIVVQVLEKNNAVEDFCELMGDDNPQEAQEGTIRNLFGLNIEENSIYGSNSEENARNEIDLLFSEHEIVP